MKDGYHLLIGSTEIDLRAPDALLQRRVDGFLICGGIIATDVIRLVAGAWLHSADCATLAPADRERFGPQLADLGR